MIPGMVLQGEGHLAAHPVLVNVIESPTKVRTELVQCRAKITRGFKFGVEPRAAHMGFVVGVILAPGVPIQQYLHDGIGGEHAGFHRGVSPFDLRKVQRTGVTSNDESAGQGHLGQRVEATFGDGTRTV